MYLLSSLHTCRVYQPEPWFNIKMTSYQYSKSHCGEKTVVIYSYLHNGISYTVKKSSVYWTSPLDAKKFRVFYSAWITKLSFLTILFYFCFVFNDIFFFYILICWYSLQICTWGRFFELNSYRIISDDPVISKFMCIASARYVWSIYIR